MITCPHCGKNFVARNHPKSRNTEFRDNELKVCDESGIVVYKTLYDFYPKYTPQQIQATVNELVRMGHWERIAYRVFRVKTLPKRKYKKKVLDITDEVC